MEHHHIEAGHDHRDRKAQPHHDRGKASSKPAERAMNAHLAHSYQGRLRDEEQHPG